MKIVRMIPAVASDHVVVYVDPDGVPAEDCMAECRARFEAAPDLYQALASLLENPVLVESWEDVQQARAALKKARGE